MYRKQGERARVRVKSLLLKEVSFQVSFESVLCEYFAEREGGRVFQQETAAKEEKAREPTVDSFLSFYHILTTHSLFGTINNCTTHIK